MMNEIKNINCFNFTNKRVLLRVDYNVPINNGHITDDTRIQRSIPTIQKILSKKGKIILISHFGRHKDYQNKNLSLKFLVPILSKILKISIKFCENCIGSHVIKKIDQLKNGEILLLENLRLYKEEEMEDPKFSFYLSKYGDIYINDAFSVCHRFHSSITVLPKFFNEKKCMGILLEQEIKNLNLFLSEKSVKPITIILGGAKLSSKIETIKNIINFADHILLGGAMSFPFIKKKGGKIGNSYINNYILIEHLIENIICHSKIENKLSLPLDSIIANSFHNNAKTKIVSTYSIPNGWQGLDIGPNSIKNFCNIIQKSKTILWNGPMGVFEFPSFSLGTTSIAKGIAKSTKNGSFSLVGGGESLSALKIEKCEKNISYLSTGGGAMLEYLKNKNLPGIIALKV
ncbi:phosphoglycerate kinase [Blattabacterium cuenoti]|uniref:phosphoglycerate kinase n=1 Tax=Blattabacterium cuenoti TaxID=1653831 RepID=UPI00163CD623|nr:phosphoglycerate kinase [Blattabacterium cuenoti]